MRPPIDGLDAAVLAAAFGLGLCLVACCASLNASDRAQVAADAVQIAGCQDVGRRCKAADAGSCWAAYDACMQDAGMR